MKNNKEELIKIMQENPDLPFVFLVCNDEIAYDYGSTVMENFIVSVGEIWEYERYGDYLYSDDESEVEEYFSNLFCDDEQYKDLSDEEYEKKMKEYINEEVTHYKAIIMNIYY